MFYDPQGTNLPCCCVINYSVFLILWVKLNKHCLFWSCMWVGKLYFCVGTDWCLRLGSLFCCMSALWCVVWGLVSECGICERCVLGGFLFGRFLWFRSPIGQRWTGFWDIASLCSVTGGLMGDSGGAYFHLRHLLGIHWGVICHRTGGRVCWMLFGWSISAVYTFVRYGWSWSLSS